MIIEILLALFISPIQVEGIIEPNTFEVDFNHIDYVQEEPIKKVSKSSSGNGGGSSNSRQYKVHVGDVYNPSFGEIRPGLNKTADTFNITRMSGNNTLKFGVITDLHYDTVGTLQELEEVMENFRYNWNLSYIISLGDMIAHGENCSKDQERYYEIREIIGNDTIYVMGNHELDACNVSDWDGFPIVWNYTINYTNRTIQFGHKPLVRHNLIGHIYLENSTDEIIYDNFSLLNTTIMYVSGHLHIENLTKEENGVYYPSLTSMTKDITDGRYYVFEVNETQINAHSFGREYKVERREMDNGI